MDDDMNFKQKFICIISGPSGSGMSSLCIRFSQNLYTLCTEQNFDGGIICYYIARTAVSTQQLSVLRNIISFNEGLPEDFEITQSKLCLINLDDLLNDVYCKVVCNLFTKGSHHRNISVILLPKSSFTRDGTVGIFR